MHWIIVQYIYKVSTHSRAKAADLLLIITSRLRIVSTHSRAKAAE